MVAILIQWPPKKNSLMGSGGGAGGSGLIRGGREGRISEIPWVLCPGRSDLVYDGHGERNSDVSIGLYMVVVWWWCDGLLAEISRLVVMERWGRSGFLLVAR
ncbi:hypothetical protein M0R45_019061 [Rubus argutus]|uniref:Uncharacterized protein n=1 Tax=Rubus argutus TaxID=59490 RepID=A0AAW1X520_RUBAR